MNRFCLLAHTYAYARIALEGERVHYGSLRFTAETIRRPQFPKCFQKKWVNFPKKIGNGRVLFLPFGKNPDLLRKRSLRRVRETFTEGSGTTELQKARATAKGHPKEESTAQVIASRLK